MSSENKNDDVTFEFNTIMINPEQNDEIIPKPHERQDIFDDINDVVMTNNHVDQKDEQNVNVNTNSHDLATTSNPKLPFEEDDDVSILHDDVNVTNIPTDISSTVRREIRNHSFDDTSSMLRNPIHSPSPTHNDGSLMSLRKGSDDTNSFRSMASSTLEPLQLPSHDVIVDKLEITPVRKDETDDILLISPNNQSIPPQIQKQQLFSGSSSVNVHPVTEMRDSAMDHLDALQHSTTIIHNKQNSNMIINNNNNNNHGSLESNNSHHLLDIPTLTTSLRDRVGSWGGMSEISDTGPLLPTPPSIVAQHSNNPTMTTTNMKSSSSHDFTTAITNSINTSRSRAGSSESQTSKSTLPAHGATTTTGSGGSHPYFMMQQNHHSQQTKLADHDAGHNDDDDNTSTTLNSNNYRKDSISSESFTMRDRLDSFSFITRDRLDSFAAFSISGIAPTSTNNTATGSTTAINTTSNSSTRDRADSFFTVRDRSDSFLTGRDRADSFLIGRDRLDSIFSTGGGGGRDRLDSLEYLSGAFTRGRDRLDSLASLGEASMNMSISDLADVAGKLESIVAGYDSATSNIESVDDSESDISSLLRSRSNSLAIPPQPPLPQSLPQGKAVYSKHKKSKSDTKNERISSVKNTPSNSKPIKPQNTHTPIQVDSEAVQAAVQAALAATSGGVLEMLQIKHDFTPVKSSNIPNQSIIPAITATPPTLKKSNKSTSTKTITNTTVIDRVTSSANITISKPPIREYNKSSVIRKSPESIPTIPFCQPKDVPACPPKNATDLEEIRARARAAAGYTGPNGSAVKPTKTPKTPKSTPVSKKRPIPGTVERLPNAKRPAHGHSLQKTPIPKKGFGGAHIHSKYATPKGKHHMIGGGSKSTPLSLKTPGSASSSKSGNNTCLQSQQKWEEMFDCLVMYVKEAKEKATSDMSEEEKLKWRWDGNVPTMYKTSDGKALGRWINNQRSAKTKGSLKLERERRLVSTGLKWSVLTTNAWGDMMEELRAYVKEKTKDGEAWDGNVPTNYKIKTNTAPDGSEIDEDKSLGRWINRQRSLYQAGKLRNDRRIELEQIGLKWAVLSTTSWTTMYEALCKYAQEREESSEAGGVVGGGKGWDGNVPASHETNEKPPKRLGRWVNRQRSAYSNKKLKEEYIEKLEKIGLKWTAHDRKKGDANSDDDNDEFDDAEAYIEETPMKKTPISKPTIERLDTKPVSAPSITKADGNIQPTTISIIPETKIAIPTTNVTKTITTTTTSKPLSTPSMTKADGNIQPTTTSVIPETKIAIPTTSMTKTTLTTTLSVPSITKADGNIQPPSTSIIPETKIAIPTAAVTKTTITATSKPLSTPSIIKTDGNIQPLTTSVIPETKIAIPTAAVTKTITTITTTTNLPVSEGVKIDESMNDKDNNPTGAKENKAA